MIVGFTGSRHGLTNQQRAALRSLLLEYQPTEFHHGACLGADEEAVKVAVTESARQAVSAVSPTVNVTAHPAKGLTNWQSEVALAISDTVLPAMPPLDRNHAIVDACEVLLACPGEMTEKLRSGTWATIRHARKRGKPLRIIYPDGSIQEENNHADSP